MACALSFKTSEGDREPENKAWTLRGKMLERETRLKRLRDKLSKIETRFERFRDKLSKREAIFQKWNQGACNYMLNK